jgi:hypothetical protein
VENSKTLRLLHLWGNLPPSKQQAVLQTLTRIIAAQPSLDGKEAVDEDL